MDRYFAPEVGRIFACFPGAEDRPGQRRMAELVFNAVADGGARFDQWRNRGAEPESKPEAVIQAVEAGTGTGKSLGYLIPALSAGRHPILVATRTKQLQRQLLEEDVPRAAGILGRPIKAVLAKGRANYLCRTAWEAVASDPHLEFSRSDQQLWLALQRWTLETQDGDREGLGRFGEGESPLWDKVNARAERCTGRQCPRFEDCYLTKLRAEVAEADLIIVNHALLLADRVLRESAFGQVLPDAPVLILDEAHDLEEQLTESCAESWSSRAMNMLFTDLRDAAGQTSGSGQGAAIAGLLEPWEQAWSEIMTWVPVEGGVLPLLAPGPEMKALADAVGAWVEAGHPLWVEARRLAAADPENPIWMRLAERVGTAFSRMEQIFAQPDGWVSTLSREGPNLVHFKSNPVDVRPFFHQHVRRGFECVVMTSATLRDGRGFNGLGLRLGLTKPEVEVAEHVESPFDFEGQGLLFVPPGLPERRPGAGGGVGDPAWVEASLSAMERMLRASRGRALLLFTSRKMLAAFRPRLETALPEITFFVQGEGLSRTQLLDRFRATPSAALLGLASFWQGVDLPGDALSLVVVSALPFAPPDDPVLQARIREADAQREGLGFIGIQVPQMTLKLKQGIGRLIRTRSDRGVVAVMDPRLMLPSEDRLGKRYAAQVRAALPPFPLTRDWERVEAFLGNL
ncbi:ATP-dependent DNA helicase [Geothrix sp. PMB-07]|uniref:ATP-dependent DNA helicase n=1 Tax=Geothrix sp. PMB-07 TaxID=3068640 RepID=UPI00274115FE|nr:ATP-dependent DNA helicase [Geothrix sp. PMB-07]WLT31872.1 ATP-dependent DNA helicase [Geothrix sp. PMB-07]